MENVDVDSKQNFLETKTTNTNRTCKHNGEKTQFSMHFNAITLNTIHFVMLCAQNKIWWLFFYLYAVYSICIIEVTSHKMKSVFCSFFYFCWIMARIVIDRSQKNV